MSVRTGAGPGGPSVADEVSAFRDGLARVDVGALSDAERVELVAELERVKGAASAAQARATHALRTSREAASVGWSTAGRGGSGSTGDAVRSVGSEVALARRESPSLADRFVGLAQALVTELPCTMAALSAGVIGERHAVEVVQQSSTLTVADRGELDRRLAPLLGRLGVRGVGRAARRVAAELDAAAVVARMEAAVRSRRVTVRPAPDGMAYLTVLGPLKDVVGAYAALQRRARGVVSGLCPDEAPEGRGAGAVAADTAMRLLSGRAVGEVQPMQVHLVMTDRSLLGLGDRRRSVFEAARIPGHGSVPAPVARDWLREAGEASVWLRRLFTSPDGRDLVAMDSRRRVFTGLLRRMLVLRDDVCVTPWCEAPIVHVDHVKPARIGGATEFGNGSGMCARCNQVKEAPGWRVQVIHPGAGGGLLRSPTVAFRVPRKRRPSAARSPAAQGSAARAPRHRPRDVEVRTPTGPVYRSQAPPILGWGWSPPRPTSRGAPEVAGTASALERHLEGLLDVA